MMMMMMMIIWMERSLLTLRASESIQDLSSPLLQPLCRLRNWHESSSAGAEQVLATRGARDS